MLVCRVLAPSRRGATSHRPAGRARVTAAALGVVCAFGLAGNAHAADARDPIGTWQGTLQGQLRVVLHVARDSAGALGATLDSPDQGATGLPVDRVTFAGDSLRLEMPRLTAGFEGRMDATGAHIEGEWRQRGVTLPLTFARAASLTAAPGRSQEPRPPFPYAAEEVRVSNDSAAVTLAGTFTHPPGEGPFPAVVMITGSGPENRDEEVFGHRPFLVIADRLTRHGIAVLRVDDRGVGGSSAGPPNPTSRDFASDVEACVRTLRGRADVDRRRIGLIGHSEGGLIAPMVAASDPGIAFIVMLAGPGVPGEQILLAQGEAIRRAAGLSDAEIARQAELQRALFAIVRAAPDSATAAARVRDAYRVGLAGMDSATVEAQVRIGVALTRSAWMRFFVDYDPRPTLARVRCPVLALNGAKDVQVPSQQNLPEVRKALARGGNRDATVLELPGLNHLFQTCTTGLPGEYASIDETVAPAALDTLTAWIERHTSKSGSPARATARHR